MWVLCAASLPLIAYAIQQRAHGVFFQTSPRLQGVLGYPNAIGAYAALAAPAALWLASSPQRARRVAGCGTLALLVLGLALSSSRGGVLAAVIGCARLAGRLRPAHRERRGAARRARRDRRLSARWGLDQPSFKALDVPFTVPAGSRLVWYSARGRAGGGVLGPLAVELAQRAARACAASAASQCWPSASAALCARPCGSRRSTAARSARSATSGTSSPAAAPSAPPITSLSSRPTCAAAGGARPGTASPRTRCAATAPARSRRSTAWRGPTSSRPARSTRRSCTCSRASGCWAPSRR